METDHHKQPAGVFTSILSGWRKLRTRPVLSTVFDVCAIIVLMVAIHAWQTRDLPEGEPAPARGLFTLDGQSIESPIAMGEVGVVYFFAPWCNVCRASMGNLNDLVSEGKVAWASAIALDFSSTSEVQQFVDDLGITMPVFLGAAQEIDNWNIRGYPTYFVINESGQIDSSSVGYSTEAGLRFRVWWAE